MQPSIDPQNNLRNVRGHDRNRGRMDRVLDERRPRAPFRGNNGQDERERRGPYYERPAQALRMPTIDLSEDANCPVCLDPIQDSQEAAFPECGHQYHAHCFGQLIFSGDDKCCVCRESLFPDADL